MCMGDFTHELITLFFVKTYQNNPVVGCHLAERTSAIGEATPLTPISIHNSLPAIQVKAAGPSSLAGIKGDRMGRVVWSAVRPPLGGQPSLPELWSASRFPKPCSFSVAQ